MHTWRVLSLAVLGLLLSSDVWASTRVGLDKEPLTFLPFQEGTRVRVVQANHGTKSHYNSLTYSYDFDMGSSVNSPSNPIYGEPVYAPLTGFVRMVRRNAPDFSCNDESSSCNHNGTGNAVVIEVEEGGYFVNLMHMQAGSIPDSIYVGRWVEQGDYLGNVGQSGFSSHPHLHMHISTYALGTSVPFDFVEAGDPDHEEWVTSQLAPNRYIIDNDRRVNLGAPIENPNAIYDNGTFTLYNRAGLALGDDYRVSTDPTPYFYWYFTLTELDGYYSVYATCRGYSSRDPDVQYRISGGGRGRYLYRDQRDFRYNRIFLARYTFTSSVRYSVRVRGSGTGSLCADAIVIELG